MSLLRIIAPIAILAIGSLFPILAAPPAITTLDPTGIQRGTSAEITVGGTLTPAPTSVWFSGTGLKADAPSAGGKVRISAAADAEVGVRWLRVINADGPSNLRPFFVGNLPEIAEKEPNNEPKSPQRIEVPSCVIAGKLAKAGDVDGYAMTLRKGQTLVAHLQANEILRSPMDGILQVLSPQGFVLEQNNDYYGLDPFITFTAPADGSYIVRVFAFPSMPDSSIRFAGAETFIYRLTLTTQGYIDHAWPLAVAKSGPAKVELRGWNIPEDLRKLSLPSTNDEFAKVSHPKLSNAVSIRIEPHPTHEAIPTTPLEAPFTLSGRLEMPGSPNLIPIMAKKGQPLVIAIESHTIGFPLMPILRVLDATDKVLVRAEPKTIDQDCELNFTPPSDGVYRIEVSDLYKHGSSRHIYRLRVHRATPDCTLTVASDRFTIPKGKTLDVPITLTPRNGFTGPIELTAEGLPDGVTMKTLKADAKTITVQFEAKNPGASSPFQIVARRKGYDGFKAGVTAKIAEVDDSLPYLWISAAK